MNPIIQGLEQAGQVYDAANTANFLKQPGTYETNPAMKPFSHGGFPTMALGFGLNDLLTQQLMRGTSQGQQNVQGLSQILANLGGIVQTNQNRSHHGGGTALNTILNIAPAIIAAIDFMKQQHAQHQAANQHNI